MIPPKSNYDTYVIVKPVDLKIASNINHFGLIRTMTSMSWGVVGSGDPELFDPPAEVPMGHSEGLGRMGHVAPFVL